MICYKMHSNGQRIRIAEIISRTDSEYILSFRNYADVLQERYLETDVWKQYWKPIEISFYKDLYDLV